MDLIYSYQFSCHNELRLRTFVCMYMHHIKKMIFKWFSHTCRHTRAITRLFTQKYEWHYVTKSQHNHVLKTFHATKINVLLFVAGAHHFHIFQHIFNSMYCAHFSPHNCHCMQSRLPFFLFVCLILSFCFSRYDTILCCWKYIRFSFSTLFLCLLIFAYSFMFKWIRLSQ